MDDNSVPILLLFVSSAFSPGVEVLAVWAVSELSADCDGSSLCVDSWCGSIWATVCIVSKLGRACAQNKVKYFRDVKFTMTMKTNKISR